MEMHWGTPGNWIHRSFFSLNRIFYICIVTNYNMKLLKLRRVKKGSFNFYEGGGYTTSNVVEVKLFLLFIPIKTVRVYRESYIGKMEPLEDLSFKAKTFRYVESFGVVASIILNK